MNFKGVHMILNGMSLYEVKRDPYDLKAMSLHEFRQDPYVFTRDALIT